MAVVEKLKAKYEDALKQKKQFQDRLRDLEADDAANIGEIWRTRDRLAYWSGRAEGLLEAIEALEA